uniref:J domain-containing protein n=1 Tax=Parastrongyloides trichosuri TaxID=131310 RepID=A0A0N4ZNH5_PARTI
MSSDTLYSLLNVSEDASYLDIKKSYRKYLLSNHPDKTGLADNQNLIEKAMFAWKQLSCDKKRKMYDKFLQEQRLHMGRKNNDAIISSCQILNEDDLQILRNEGSILIPCSRCDNDINLTLSDYLCIIKEALFECSGCSMLTKIQICYNK